MMTRDAQETPLLREIDRTGSTRASIAAAYQQMLRNRRRGSAWHPIDWPAVNGALRKRFKPSGVAYIERQGWKR